MNPQVEVVKDVQILTSHPESMAKGAVVALHTPKRGRVKVRGVKVGALAVDDPFNLPVPETDDQKNAFEYYLGLGSERSIRKVAENFHCRIDLLIRWSKKFHWIERITEIETLPAKDRVKRNLTEADVLGSEYTLAKFKTLMVEDPERPGKRIPNPDITVSAAKDAFTIKAIQKKGVIEDEAHSVEMDRGPGGGTSGRGKGGFMVNVVITR